MRVFLLSPDVDWISDFARKLQAANGCVDAALNVADFQQDFNEAETDVLVVRRFEVAAVVEYLHAMRKAQSGCGVIWLHACDSPTSLWPYYGIADHCACQTLPDDELMARIDSLYARLRRNGWHQ